MVDINELDNSVKSLEKELKEIKEINEKKDKIRLLKTQIKQEKNLINNETINNVLNVTKKAFSTLVKEVNTGIDKIQEHNRKQLEKGWNKNANISSVESKK